MNIQYKGLDDLDEEMCEKIETRVKKFIEDFPDRKQQLKDLIKQLQDSADSIEKIHRDCTITKVVASSTGVVSGILAIVGLALAPVTAGVSLALSMGGVGLGVASTVTSTTAGIIDSVSESRGKAQLDKVEEMTSDIMEPLAKMLSGIRDLILGVNKIVRNIVPNSGALKLLKDKPGLISTTGALLSMTKKARIRGAVFAGIYVLVDIVAIVQDSMHLLNGAKTPTAAKLREKAQELEKKLQELSCIYETLLEMEATPFRT